MCDQNRLTMFDCQPIRHAASAKNHDCNDGARLLLGNQRPDKNPQTSDVSDGFLLFQAGHLALQMLLKPQAAFESHRRTIMSEKLEMPNPTEAELASPEFEAIWQVIKSWDVNVPTHYEGYCGANGSHVKIILDALRSAA